MLNAPAGPLRTARRGPRAALAAAGLSAALLVAGCGSGGSAPESTAAASSAGSVTPSPSAASSPSASASTPATQNPKATATVGALVSGFPTTLIPLMPGATLQSTSLDKTKPLVTASLVATTKAKSADVITFYSDALQKQGFTALPGDAVGSVASKDFTRAKGAETVNLALVVTGSSVTFTVGANVLPASLK